MSNDGLEQWLEVERECGVRTLEVDRSLIAAPSITTAPESTATSACGISCSIISERVIKVVSSIPFATLTIF